MEDERVLRVAFRNILKMGNKANTYKFALAKFLLEYSNKFTYDELKLAVKTKKLTIFEPHFRRNFIHVRDVVNGITFTIKNFNKMKSNVYNLGLSSANISKLMLANKIKKIFKKLTIKIVKNKKDPDKRDYFVSNKKIEKKRFKAQIKLEDGIFELIQVFINDKNKIINNY